MELTMKEAKAQINKWITWCIFLFIQGIFVYKYVPRYLSNSAFFIGLFVLAATAICAYFAFIKPVFWSKKYPVWLAIAALVIGSAVLFYFVPLSSLNVDRYDVINSFFETLFDGKYPYLARSFRGSPPGPMPFYFVLNFPFYLVGQLGVFSMLGPLLFLVWIGRQKQLNVFVVLLILMLLPVWWEIACRSNLFTNGFIVLYLLSVLLAQWQKQQSFKTTTAIAVGLVVCTRMVFVIPFIFIGLLLLKKKAYLPLSKLVLWSSFAFALPFIGLFIVYNSLFLKINPFVVQGEYLMPFWLTIASIILAAVMAYFTNKSAQIIRNSGYALFATMAIYLTYHLINFGWQASILGSGVDISYFIVCIPFLLHSYFKTAEL